MLPIRRIPLLCRTVSLDLSWLAIDSRTGLKNDLHLLPHRRLVEVIVVEFLFGVETTMAGSVVLVCSRVNLFV
jgi:hypothetical protein